MIDMEFVDLPDSRTKQGIDLTYTIDITAISNGFIAQIREEPDIICESTSLDKVLYDLAQEQRFHHDRTKLKEKLRIEKAQRT